MDIRNDAGSIQSAGGNMTALLPPSRLAEIRERAEKATPGPLLPRRINNDPKPWAIISPLGQFGDEIVAGYLNEDDAHLYASVPDLLSHIAALQAELDAQKAETADAREKLAQCEMSLAVYDEGRSSEYWERHRQSPDGGAQ